MRYTVNGTWTESVASALTPALPSSPVSTTWGWSRVSGAPGTHPVPSPKPGVHSVSPSRLNQPSWCSPDVIYPALYRSDPDVAWRHVPVRPMNMLPVPAANNWNMAGTAMRARRTGGTHQVAQPGVVQSWPDLLGRISSNIGTAAGKFRGPSSALPPQGQ